MLFSEIYSSYFNAVAAILELAVEKELTEKELREAVMKKAFDESMLVIPAALKSERWPLLTKELETPVFQKPAMPLTKLQKQWLKTLLLDPRIQLFSPGMTGLEDVEPLYFPEMIVYFDRYEDGDPYQDSEYIEHFQVILKAIREGRNIRLHYRTAHGKEKCYRCVPTGLEYSARDDKFRVRFITAPQLALDQGFMAEQMTANLSRVTAVELEDILKETPETLSEREEELILELTDERGAMQRAMTSFSDFEKDTIRLDENHYRIHLWYNREEETDLLIRILSFGPMVKVTEPRALVDQIWARLKKQKENVI